MADNKNQHFVPKVHFRPFSVEGQGGAIQLFNLDLLRAIPNASVRKQCSGDYFYGHDRQLEKAIQTIEGAYGQMLLRLLPIDAEPTALDGIALRRFMLLQNFRTEAAAKSASQIMAAMARFPGSFPEGEAFDIKEAMRVAVEECQSASKRGSDSYVERPG